MISNLFWSTGKRSVNQDSVSLQILECRHGTMALIVVADGIGGLKEGETASGFVTEQLVEWFYEKAVCTPFRKHCQLAKDMTEKVRFMYEKLRDYGRIKSITLGTTCTCIVFWNRNYLLMHIGDSGAYLLTGKKVRQLTVSHHTAGGELNACIGSMGYYEPEFYIGRVRKGEAVCLCSDGFYREGRYFFGELLCPMVMENEEIIGRRLSMLSESNLKKGECDNQTAVYLKF